MVQQLVDKRDLDFVIWEQFDNEAFLENEKYEAFNKKSCEMVLSEARKIAVKEMLPTMADADRDGVAFEDGKVKIPDYFRQVFNLLKEGDWGNLGLDTGMGGQGAPHFLSSAVREHFVAANYSLLTYLTMGMGAANMIYRFGSQEQREKYVPKMVSAEWGGTMLLSEPQAGSDVGNLETSAVRNEDGTYSLTGNKIFITAGDHDLVENIIHPVLARVEGAPGGTKGISIFIVPKYLVNDDGSLGERNDIWCTGVEHKHGMNGSATCSMALGARGKCIGYLMGEENKGMRVMFNLLNNARMHTGHQAASYASACYVLAVNHARERIQGRELGQPHDSEPVPIIKHPDVRRNLLWMKSYLSGMRSFFYYMQNQNERSRVGKTEAERTLAAEIFDLLTPVVKSYLANRSYEVCVQAMQVFAGSGYTKDYLVEQYLRDCKIVSIYEGTCGIQAMDLLGRKLQLQNGKVFMSLIGEMQKTITEARNKPSLAELADRFEGMVDAFVETSKALGANVMKPDFKTAFAHSLPFLDVTGDTIVAWMLLWRSLTATENLDSGPKKKDISFYNGQLKTTEFFFHTIVPTSIGRMTTVAAMHPAAMEIDDDGFGSL